MDKLLGLPAHPLLVHIPIVLLPLAAVGVVVMAVKAEWHRRFRWVVLALGAAGTLGAVLATSAGEQLEERVESVDGREVARRFGDHREGGETAQTFALVFLVMLVVFVVVPWWLERRARNAEQPSTPATNRWVTIGVTVLALTGATGSVITIVEAGHSGADVVWDKYVESRARG